MLFNSLSDGYLVFDISNVRTVNKRMITLRWIDLLNKVRTLTVAFVLFSTLQETATATLWWGSDCFPESELDLSVSTLGAGAVTSQWDWRSTAVLKVILQQQKQQQQQYL